MGLVRSQAEGCQREDAVHGSPLRVQSGMRHQREVTAWVERWVVAALRIDTRFVSSVDTQAPISLFFSHF